MTRMERRRRRRRILRIKLATTAAVLALTTALMGMVIEPDNDDTENTFLFLVLPVRMQE